MPSFANLDAIQLELIMVYSMIRPFVQRARYASHQSQDTRKYSRLRLTALIG